MKKTVSVLGCGWLGKSIAVNLLKNGFFVNNLDEITNILSKLQKYPLKYNKIRKGAYSSVKKFNIDRNVDKILYLYKKFKN